MALAADPNPTDKTAIISGVDVKRRAVAAGMINQAVINGMGLRPSPSDIANLRAQIEATPPACMIIDPNDHTALAYALAEEYSIKTVEFSQLGEVVAGENAYLNLMHGAVAAFKTCFQ